MSENKKTTSSHTQNSNFNFNYSFPAGTANKKPVLSLKDILVLDDVSFSPVNNDAALVVNSRTGKMIVLSSTMANLIQKCDAFRTADQHLQYIKKLFNLSEAISNELKSVITSMNENGLMLSAEDLKTILLKDYTPRKQATGRNWVLGVGSCDRPDLLKRMLDSALPYIQQYSPKPEFIFIDDSRDKQNQQKNFETIKIFCEASNIDIHYWDRSNRTDFANNLAERHPEYSQSIHWLLNPEVHGEDAASYGLGKNFIQLHTQNKPLIMLDDDCILSPINRLDNKQNIRLNAEENEFTPFTGMDGLLKTTTQMEINPFKSHLDQLNVDVLECIMGSESSLDNPGIWQGLEREVIFKFTNKDCIGMTTNCVAGAQNSRHMDVFFTYPDCVSKLETFLSSVLHEEDIYQISWCGPENNNIGRYLPFICTTMSGLASTKIPPPTIPVGRNEDLFLGELRAYLNPMIQTHQFNWALTHLPEPERKWSPQKAQTSVPVAASLIFRKALEECADNCPYKEPTERLEYFGAYLDSIINNSESGLKKYVTDIAVSYLTNEIFRLENIANDVKHHALYLKGVRQLLESRKQELMQILNSGSIELIDEFVGMATPMGKALRQWPKIIELAQPHI